MPSQIICARFPEELITLLNEERDRSNRPISEIIRDALNAYFDIEPHRETTLLVLDKNDLIELIDSRLSVKHNVKHNVRQVKQDVIQSVKPVEQDVIHDVKQVKQDVIQSVKHVKQDVKPDVKQILQLIKSNHDRGIEPMVSDIAEELGVPSMMVGRALGSVGFRSRDVSRGGRKGKYYTFDLKEEMERLLS